MERLAGRAQAEVLAAVESSSAIRKAGEERCPSIDISCVDDAVDCHLMARINDLWSPPANEEKEDDLTEALRTALRVAIREVLAGHRVRVVES